MAETLRRHFAHLGYIATLISAAAAAWLMRQIQLRQAEKLQQLAGQGQR